MAMHVINCYSSDFNKKQLLKSKQIEIYSQFKGHAKHLTDFISGDYKGTMHWIQAFCYQLLVKSDPKESLKDVVKEFNEKVYKQEYQKSHETCGTAPLLWLLIKFYALNNSEPDVLSKQLLTYSGVLIYDDIKSYVQDYRLQFIVTLSIYQLLKHVSVNDGYLDDNNKTLY